MILTQKSKYPPEYVDRSSILAFVGAATIALLYWIPFAVNAYARLRLARRINIENSGNRPS